MKKNQTQKILLERVVDDILCGEFSPRERLVESDLMGKYGVPRNALRNVLKELQVQKLVVHQLNRGVTVAEVTEKDAIELYRLRVLLESYAAFQVMANLTATNIEELEVLQVKFIAAAQERDFRGMSQANNSFHEMIFQISGNQITSDLIRDLRTRSNLLLYHIWRSPGQFDKSINDHGELLNSLEKKDAEAFIRINARHVLASLQSYLGRSLEELGLKAVVDGTFKACDLLKLMAKTKTGVGPWADHL